MDAPARSTPLERWKPRAGARTQLLLAAALWTVVGALLLAVGAHWSLAAAGPGAGMLLVIGGAGVGLLKSRFILDRMAKRAAARIAERGDGRCAGGFLSLRSWLLVALMSGSGRFLRGGPLPDVVIGPLYAAIGTGLLFSSRIAWKRRLAAGNSRHE